MNDQEQGLGEQPFFARLTTDRSRKIQMVVAVAFSAIVLAFLTFAQEQVVQFAIYCAVGLPICFAATTKRIPDRSKFWKSNAAHAPVASALLCWVLLVAGLVDPSMAQPIDVGAEVGNARPSQPNIIYINTDDWGIGKVPCYKLDDASMKIIKTPNLDKLAENGMRFTRAYAGNAVCGPSRCSLLTGKHGGHAAWRANHGGTPVAQWPPDYPMLGEVARKAGYTTAGFGKLSMGGMHKPETITLTGWDYWLGYLGHVDCRSFYGTYIWENGVKKPIPENSRDKIGQYVPVLGDHGVFTEDLYTDKIIEFISENKEKPFFIYFASTVPHGDAKTVPFQGLWTPSLEGYDQVGGLTKLEQLYAALMYTT